jgi:hypothetical protein
MYSQVKKNTNYIVLPIRRITKIALACKKYTIITNFLTEIRFNDASSMMPISVGSGEAIKILAKAPIKYALMDSGIHLLTIRTTLSFESFSTSSLKPCLTKKTRITSLIKAPAPAITPANSRLCSFARISKIPVPAAEVKAYGYNNPARKVPKYPMNTRALCRGVYAKPEKKKYTTNTLIINSESFGYLIFPSTKISSL